MSYWVIALEWLRPGCHLTGQTSSLCGADIGFVEGMLGKTEFAVHVVGC